MGCLNLSDTLEAVRTLVLDGSDVRVDLVLVGYATVPLRFRDMVAQTGGSVQVIGDVDELGPIAQRIKNDVASGSWVSRPQQGYIDVGGRFPRGPSRPRRNGPPHTGGDPKNLCHQRRQARNALHAGTIPEADLGDEEMASFVIDNFKRTQYVPSEYEQVTKTLNGLIDLSDSTVRFRDRLNALDSQLSSTTLEKEVDEILANVRTAKRQLRDLYGSESMKNASALTDTDDYLEWNLRKRWRRRRSGSRRMRRSIMRWIRRIGHSERPICMRTVFEKQLTCWNLGREKRATGRLRSGVERDHGEARFGQCAQVECRCLRWCADRAGSRCTRRRGISASRGSHRSRANPAEKPSSTTDQQQSLGRNRTRDRRAPSAN